MHWIFPFAGTKQALKLWKRNSPLHSRLEFQCFFPTILSLLPRCHALKWPDICREGLYSSSIYLPWGLMIEEKTQKKREKSTEGNVWVFSVIPEGLSRFTLCFCLDHKVYAWQDGWQNTKCRRLAGNDLSVPRPSFPGVSLLGSLATVVKLPRWRQMEDAGVSCLFGRLKHLVCGSLLPSVLNEAPGCRMKPLCLL